MQFPKTFIINLFKNGRYGRFYGLKRMNRSFCQLRHEKYKEKLNLVTCELGRKLFLTPYFFSGRPVSAQYSSALFVSGLDQHTSEVDLDLDLNRRLNSIEELSSNLKIRGSDINIDKLVESYKLYKQLLSVKQKLEEEREDIAKRMASLVKVKQTEDVQNSKLILSKRGKEVRKELKDLMINWWKIEEEVILTALRLPNVVHPWTPVTDAEILLEMNKEAANKDTGHCHWDVGRKLDWIKFSNVGPRAFYLKGKLALLEQALINYTTNSLEEQGFLQLKCSEFFRSLVVEGCGESHTDPNQIYRLHSGEMDSDHAGFHLRGISPMSFAAYLTKMNIDVKTLPQKYFAVGRSYVPRGGLKDGHLPGLYGALQSVKAELCGVCEDNDESQLIFNQFYTCVLDLYRQFNLPLRVVQIPARALHPREQLRHDIQLWAPSCSDYITVSSVSLSGDYISRRLMITHSRDIKNLQNRQYVHMVHAEVMDVTRLVAILVESGHFTNQTYHLPALPMLDGYWL